MTFKPSKLPYSFTSSKPCRGHRNPQQIPAALAVMAFLASLAGCGGGGSDSHSGSAIKPPTGTAFTSASDATPSAALVSSVPTPTYPASSEELAAFNAINESLYACGFGKVRQNVALDTAARGHADWQLRNGYSGHYQIGGTPGFTAVAPADRAATAGYAAPGSFVVRDIGVSQQGTSDTTGRGADAVAKLFSAPLHARKLLEGAIEVGIAVRSDRDQVSSPPGGRIAVWIDLANLNATGNQEPVTDAVLTYPCEGRTGIPRQLQGEDPNPIPGRDLLAQPLGPTIQVRTRTGATLVITSSTLKDVATGTAITLRPPAGARYGNEPFFGPPLASQSHETWIAADAPLKPFTAYEAAIAGTRDGVAFTKKFSFTTGA